MEEKPPKYHDLTVELKCSVPIPIEMTKEEFQTKLLDLLTANRKFNFHGQLNVKYR